MANTTLSGNEFHRFSFIITMQYTQHL